MRNLTGTTWGASKDSLLTVYRTLIRSIIDYGAEVLDSANVGIKEMLDKIQYQALRICCGAMKGTALSALQNECGEPPLALRRYKKQLNYCVKIKAIPSHPSASIIDDHWTNYYSKYNKGVSSIYKKVSEFMEKVNIKNKTSSKTPPWSIKPFEINTSLNQIFKKNEHHTKGKALALEVMSQYKEYLEIYTDGSKYESVTASAYYIPERDINKNYRISDKISIYTAELTAIKSALKWINENKEDEMLNQNRHIVIYTDSLSAAKTLASKKHASRSNLVNEIFEIKSKIKNQIAVVWIPSHTGIKGNEEADRLAREALKHQTIDCVVDKEYKEFSEEIDKHVLRSWQEKWSTCNTGRHNYKIEPKVSYLSKYRETHCRQKEIQISRLRLGKCRLNHYLYKMGCHETGLCNTCKIPETIDHYLLNCSESNINNKLNEASKRLNVTTDLTTVLSHKTLIDIIYRNIKKNL